MADPQETLLQKIKEQGDIVRKLKVAKESNEKGKTSYNLEEIDEYLCQYSYICGYTPTTCDIETMKILKNVDFKRYKFIKRWWYHMRSFNNSEIALFPESNPPDVLKMANYKAISIDDQVCCKLAYECSYIAFL